MTNAHGAEDVRIFHKECVSLAEAGYDVYLVERGESYDKNGVHIVGVGEIPQSRRKRMTEGARRVYERALMLDCDIYHIHDPELLPFALKLKKKGKKVIFDSHENTADSIYEKTYLPLAIRSMVGKSYTLYEAHVCSRMDAVITVTPTQTKYFKTISPCVCEVRNYPIVPDDYVLPGFTGRALGFAGGITENWSHQTVIEAIETIPDCKYILCGADNEYRKGLENLTGWEKVDYRGMLPHAEVAKVLSACSVGIALLKPCRNSAWKVGTMGNTKIFEEMMAGLPVVCTDFELWKEFVDRYQCGICVDPMDVGSVRAAIEKLINDPGLARRMGENGRRAVEEEFNWRTQSCRLLELYNAIGAGRG